MADYCTDRLVAIQGVNDLKWPACIRLVIFCFCLYWLNGQIDGSLLMEVIFTVDFYLVVICFFLAMAQVFLSFMRWKLVVQAKNVKLSFCDDFKIFYFSVFFGQWLIAGIGSDVIKTLQLKNNTVKLSTVNIIILLIADRIYALAGLMFTAILMIILYLPILSGDYNDILVFIAIGCIGAMIILKMLKKKSKNVRALFFSLFNTRIFFVKTLMLSFVNVLIGISIFAIIFHDISGVPDWRLAFGIGWVALAASVVPVTPGGWGVREFALMLVGGIFELDSEIIVASSLFFGLIFMLVSAPAVFFIEAEGFVGLSKLKRLFSEKYFGKR